MISLEQAGELLPHGYEISEEVLASVIADSYARADLAIEEYLDTKKLNKPYLWQASFAGSIMVSSLQ